MDKIRAMICDIDGHIGDFQMLERVGNPTCLGDVKLEVVEMLRKHSAEHLGGMGKSFSLQLNEMEEERS
jgi:hypothetical protein